MQDKEIIRRALDWHEKNWNDKLDFYDQEIRLIQKALELKENEMKKKHENEIGDYLAEIQKQRRQIERMKSMEKKGWMK